MKQTQITAPQAGTPIGPYSQAILGQGSFLFVSGQIPLDPVTGAVVGDDVQAQTTQVFKNLNAILAQANTDLSRVVKTTVFLQSMADFPAMNEVYAQAFAGTTPPARSTIQVARLPKDALVEIECIALVPE